METTAAGERLSELIGEVLLASVEQNLVIFIDEIDSVLGLKFSLDDFFALIRTCYNKRVDQSKYYRLAFALFGVATPSDLIQDKTRTPFNIGKAIELYGFEFEQAQVLVEGVTGKVDNPQAVLKEILAWTGGQPFLTQKLCKLVVQEAEIDPPQQGLERGEKFPIAEWVEKVVRSRIISNWESTDEPEHLKTIRDRLLSSEKRAGALLGLYQQILQAERIAADGSSEQMELRLSGLVVQQQGYLRVYNPIYESIFGKTWINQTLNNLRPYAEAIAVWLDSNCQDESQLLHESALQEALNWAFGKSLSNQDYQFLAASQALDRQNILAALEAAQKAREQFREELLAVLNQKKGFPTISQTPDGQDLLAALEAERKAQEQLRVELLPLTKQAIHRLRSGLALVALALVSLSLSVQDFLLEQRVLVQAVYRQLTNQVPSTKQPPVLLVQIDEDSIRKAAISNPVPMNRRYLAQLVDKLSAMNAKVVGIEYLLNGLQKENDQKLAESLRTAVQKNQTSFVFATFPNSSGGWFDVLPELDQPNWSLQGDDSVLGNEQLYMTLVHRHERAPWRLPFSYLLALAYRLNFEQPVKPPQPQLQSSRNLLSQLSAHVTKTTGKDYRDIFSSAARLQPLTNFAYQLRQMWLHPLVDFSIPPEQVYKLLPAWQLLEKSADSLKLDPHQQPVVIIAPGGYAEADLSGLDNFPLPAAVGYWRSQEFIFTGAEVHAYMIHHFLNQRLVVPIPDLWMVGIAALLGEGTAVALKKSKGENKQRKGKLLLPIFPSGKGKWLRLLAGVTAIYGVVSLQLYITAAVLLPWFLPTVTFWGYVLLALPKEKRSVPK